MIGGLIDERQSLRDDVLRDIARSSSFEQQISGPMVVVPYRKYERRWIEKDGQSVQETYTLNGNLYFLPETMDADISVETELRARGIYQAGCSTPRAASGPFQAARALGHRQGLR
jgi:inner membrane protein